MNPLCPICHHAGVGRRRQTVDAVAAMHAPPARDADRYERMRQQVARLWPDGFVEACVCNACSLGFAWPLVEGDAAFYSVLHERVGYPSERWEFRRARENHRGTSGRVLDVGAGAGDFLRSLPEGVEKHAVEASPRLCAALRERGVNAHRSLDEAAMAGPFATVTLFHVLQYFADPVAALAKCRSMLAPDGRLLISLPNALAGGSLEDLTAPPHPLTRWSKPAIERAITAAGLEAVECCWIPRGWKSLLWDAHAATRARAAKRPRSLAGRIDALPAGRRRTVLLAGLAISTLPKILQGARARLRYSQMWLACAACR